MGKGERGMGLRENDAREEMVAMRLVEMEEAEWEKKVYSIQERLVGREREKGVRGGGGEGRREGKRK